MATPQAQKRQDGFDCEFTERPQEQFQTICPICLLVLREPHQVSCCGYNFCRLCIERVQSQRSACPTCNQTRFTLFLNKGLKRSLYAFRVRCSHKKEGCQWSGELGELDKHLNEKPHPHGPLVGCEFVDVECCHCYGHFKRCYIITHQIKECTRQPYILSLITTYIDCLQKSAGNTQEKEEQRQESGQISREEYKKGQAQLFSQTLSTKKEVVVLKNEVQTLHRELKNEVRKQQLVDQKLLWWWLAAIVVVLLAFTYITWTHGSQKKIVVLQGNGQLEDKEIVLREEFEIMKQQLKKLETESAGARQGMDQLRDKYDLLIGEFKNVKQLNDVVKGSAQEIVGFLILLILLFFCACFSFCLQQCSR